MTEFQPYSKESPKEWWKPTTLSIFVELDSFEFKLCYCSKRPSITARYSCILIEEVIQSNTVSALGLQLFIILQRQGERDGLRSFGVLELDSMLEKRWNCRAWRPERDFVIWFIKRLRTTSIHVECTAIWRASSISPMGLLSLFLQVDTQFFPCYFSSTLESPYLYSNRRAKLKAMLEYLFSSRSDSILYLSISIFLPFKWM